MKEILRAVFHKPILQQTGGSKDGWKLPKGKVYNRNYTWLALRSEILHLTVDLNCILFLLFLLKCLISWLSPVTMFKWKQIKILVRLQSHQFQTRTNHQIQSDHTVDFFQFLFFFNRQEPKKILFFIC